MANTPKTLALPPKLLTALENVAKTWNVRTTTGGWKVRWQHRPSDVDQWETATWAMVLRYAATKFIAAPKTAKKATKKATKKKKKKKH